MTTLNSRNVAFFGTSDRSIPILEVLKANFNLKLIITKDDVRFGRKQELKETQVKQWAKRNQVHFITIDKLSSDKSEEIIEQIKYLEIDLGIVADFSFIIPEKIINAFPFKMVNIHFSNLPKYRGASPVQFSILNGDLTTGIAFYILDKGLDTGEILEIVNFDIKPNDTADTLYENMFLKASELVPNVINKYIEGKLTPRPQNHEEATYTYSATNPKRTTIDKNDAYITSTFDQQRTDRFVRAFFPWPVAWTYVEKLVANPIFNLKNLNLKNKDVEKLRIKIYEGSVNENHYIPAKIQLEGGKIIDWKDFLNGYFEKVTR